MIQVFDVKPEGIEGTDIGFSTINVWFHNLTGVHMKIYTITDWLGLVAVFVCMGFGLLGLCQWIKRRKLLKVDFDIRMLGAFYVIVILEYLIFEMIPINYRPIFIDGRMEASYPSSTTLLVISVMPTLIFELKRRMKKGLVRKMFIFVTASFSLFMVIGRTGREAICFENCNLKMGIGQTLWYLLLKRKTGQTSKEYVMCCLELLI